MTETLAIVLIVGCIGIPIVGSLVAYGMKLHAQRNAKWLPLSYLYLRDNFDRLAPFGLLTQERLMEEWKNAPEHQREIIFILDHLYAFGHVVGEEEVWPYAGAHLGGPIMPIVVKIYAIGREDLKKTLSVDTLTGTVIVH